jgi:hypothetical protein
MLETCSLVLLCAGVAGMDQGKVTDRSESVTVQHCVWCCQGSFGLYIVTWLTDSMVDEI